MVDETEFDIMDADHESRLNDKRHMPWCIECGAYSKDECACACDDHGFLGGKNNDCQFCLGKKVLDDTECMDWLEDANNGELEALFASELGFRRYINSINN